MNTTSTPKRSARFFYEELPDENELMLVDKEQGEVRVLNADAGGVWLLCDGQRNEQQLLEALKGMRPDTGEEALRSQLNDALALFEKEGLIER